MAEVYGNTITGNNEGFSLYNGQAKLTYTTSSTATAVTVTFTLSFSMAGTTPVPPKVSRSTSMNVSGSAGGYSGSGKITLTTQKNPTTSVKNFSTGAGVTLVSSKTVTYTKTTAAQTKTISFSVTNSTISKTSSGSVNIAVPALASYTVAYNANGGTNAPASQTKYYNTALTLKTDKPTRTGYTFKGWSTTQARANHKNTNQQPDQIDYASGGSYTGNAAITLYAAWEKNYIKPSITSVSVERCKSGGGLDDEGAYAKVSFNWAIDTTKHSGNTVGSLTVQIGTVTSTRTVVGTSGTQSLVMGGNYLPTETYPITITLTDTCVEATTTTWSGELALARFPIDMYTNKTEGYMSVGLCKSAPENISGIFLGEDLFIDVDDTAGSGTTDYDIITAITNLGWASDCLIDM